MLSAPAFNAFLKTLEEPPPHVVFVLATTDPKKIPATVLSRCQRFDFRPISPEPLTASLTAILEQGGRALRAGARCRCSCARPRGACATRCRCSTPPSPTARASSTRRAWRGCSAPPRPCTCGASSGRCWRATAAPRSRPIDRAARGGRGPGRALPRGRRGGAPAPRAQGRRPARPSPTSRRPRREALRAAAAPVSVDELIYLLRAFLDADAEMRRSPHPRVELEIAAVRADAPARSRRRIETLLAKVEEAARPAAAAGAPAGGPGGRPRRPARRAVVRPASSRPPPSRPAAASPSRSRRRTAPRPRSDRTPRPMREPSAAATRWSRAAEDSAAGRRGRSRVEGWQRVIAEVMKKKALLGSVLQHGDAARRRGRRADARARRQSLPPGDARTSAAIAT